MNESCLIRAHLKTHYSGDSHKVPAQSKLNDVDSTAEKSSAPTAKSPASAAQPFRPQIFIPN